MNIATVPAMVLANCAFEKTTTPATLAYGLSLVALSVVLLAWVSRQVPRFPMRLLAMITGVLVFELFTAPMWLNERLGRFAYVYHDVSWIMTLFWSALILALVVLVDRRLAGSRAAQRFAIVIALGLVPAIIEEMLAVALHIRSYSPEVLSATSGKLVNGVPIEILYYVPVFMALVLASYRFWELAIDGYPIVPVRSRNWLRATAIAAIAVFLFEIMVEPMATNANFPAWSYVFHDISLVMSGLWVVLIGAAAYLVGRLMFDQPLGVRFGAAVIIVTALAVPIEAWLMQNGYRIYGPSAVRNFTGIQMVGGAPIEILFAIPCYLALIIAFIRYWEIVADNRL